MDGEMVDAAGARGYSGDPLEDELEDYASDDEDAVAAARAKEQDAATEAAVIDVAKDVVKHKSKQVGESLKHGTQLPDESPITAAISEMIKGAIEVEVDRITKKTRARQSRAKKPTRTIPA